MKAVVYHNVLSLIKYILVYVFNYTYIAIDELK